MEEKRVYSFKNEDGKIEKFAIVRATNADVEDGEIEYSKVFVESLKKGLPPRNVLTGILASTGAWTEEDNKKIDELDAKIDSISAILEKEGVTEEEKKSVGEELSLLNEKVNQMRSERNAYYSHTAEAKASDAQRDMMVVLTTTFEKTGTRVWASIDDFRKENDSSRLFRSVYEYLTFSNDMPSTMKNEEEIEEGKVATPADEQVSKA